MEPDYAQKCQVYDILEKAWRDMQHRRLAWVEFLSLADKVFGSEDDFYKSVPPKEPTDSPLPPPPKKS